MAAHVLDDQLMENEEDIRNKILNNFSCEKTQVINLINKLTWINEIYNNMFTLG